MNTTYETRAEARKARIIRKRRRRALATILTVSTLSTVVGVSLTTIKMQKEYDNRIYNLRLQISDLAIENRDLSAALLESENRLRVFVDTNEVRTSAAPIYNIELSEELQEYTYAMCLNYGIVDHYELVLAMMWHESNFTPDVISRTNDYGIMQINVCNHEWLSKT
jgi:hypothetical protein